MEFLLRPVELRDLFEVSEDDVEVVLDDFRNFPGFGGDKVVLDHLVQVSYEFLFSLYEFFDNGPKRRSFLVYVI